jgi:hypothetical protein
MNSSLLNPLKIKTRHLFALVLVGLFLTGCASLVRTEQSGVTEGMKLSAGETVGQTFVARYTGLQEIGFFLSPSMFGDGDLKVYLRSDPQADDDLARSNILHVSDVDAPGFYRFSFPVQANSNQTYYYAVLEMTGGGELLVGAGAGNTYLDGACYQNGFPLDVQTTFQLGYAPDSAILGMSIELLRWVGYLVLGAFLFLLPGWGLFSMFLHGWERYSWPEKAGLSVGLSLGLYPLILLWTDAARIHLGVANAWIPALTGLGLILWKNRGKILEWITLRKVRAAISLKPRRKFDWLNLLLPVVLTLVLLVRYWVMRTLEAPAWGDSVQHTVMAQRMLESGGLFSSWEPYAHYASLTVQYGFAAFVALFAWLSGQNSLQSTLIIGQILNGLAVLAIYPLAVRVARGNRWAGAGALIVAGLLSPMPAFYVNWGRYAQLAGQAILPVALWLAWETVESFPAPLVSGIRHRTWGGMKVIFLAAVSLAGMTLCYYRMPFYYATFILILLIGGGIPALRDHRIGMFRVVIILGVLALVTVVLIAPWLPRLLGSNLAGAVEAGVTQGSSLDAVLADYQAWRYTYNYVPPILAWITLVGLVWSLFKKAWMVALQGLWVILLTAIIAGSLIHLPGANMMQSFAIQIALYIPIGIVVGWMVGEIASYLQGRWMQGVLAFAMGILALYGAWSQRNIPEPESFVLVTRPDVRAMTWIRDNTDPSDVFLVEAYSIYEGTSIIGSDAGWWLPILAGRQSTLPPQYALMNEIPIESGYTQSLVDLVNSLNASPLDTPRGIALLCDRGITHLFIGQRQGYVGFDVVRLFSAETLLNSPYFRLLYHQDRVYVFGLIEGACP